MAIKDDWKDDAAVLAARAACPTPGCGEINIVYQRPDRDGESLSDRLEFTCSRCGTEFSPFVEEVLFHSVRSEWLWAGDHPA